MLAKYSVVLFVLLVISIPVLALDNGLARKPPMGWLSWARFECIVDCKTYPNDCINEKLYKDMIDRLANDGYAQLGYNFVNIDDCWMEKSFRDNKTGKLVPDHNRFPNGIKVLSDYAHEKGLLLGIYEDIGTLTCGGYPGTFFANVDHTELDARTFSDWEVDSLKLDGCYMDSSKYNTTYPAYSRALAKQKHPIMYACSWPAYLKSQPDELFEQLQKYCNYWRNYGDIQDSANSMFSIINFYGDHCQQYAKFHGPGSWFDPDMLLIGSDGLSYEQSKTQMAFWCLWSAPLLMSADLRNIRPAYKEILQNKYLIAVNQDPLGKMGLRVVKTSGEQVWVKQLSPENGHDAFVVLYYHTRTLGPPRLFSYKLSQLLPQLKTDISYDAFDLFDNYAHVGTFHRDDKLVLSVHTSGSVRIVKLVAH